MSVTHIPLELRRTVFRRAKHQCEYCLIDEQDTFLGCQIDHVIAEKHGGQTTLENLAVACTLCNRAKGSDIATLVESILTPLFNPRRDTWQGHFQFGDDLMTIQPRTSTGQGTITLLNLNAPERLLERQLLQEMGLYPPINFDSEHTL